MTKNRFLLAFVAVVLILALVRWTLLPAAMPADSGSNCEQISLTESKASGTTSSPKHRILSVPSYKVAFPDSQSVQIVAANKWGVRPVKNRDDAEQRKRELVYVGVSPYYHVDPLRSSIPYLVPRAAT